MKLSQQLHVITVLLMIIEFFILLITLKSAKNTSLISPMDRLPDIKVRAYEAPKTEREQIEDYIREVFGEDANDAFKVLECENRSLNPNAVHTNRNNTQDVGVFQVNIHAHRKTMEGMKDWKANIDYAYKIFTRQGWSPWTCSSVIGVTPFYLR